VDEDGLYYADQIVGNIVNKLKTALNIPLDADSDWQIKKFFFERF
jgi:hypothetical protein